MNLYVGTGQTLHFPRLPHGNKGNRLFKIFFAIKDTAGPYAVMHTHPHAHTYGMDMLINNRVSACYRQPR